MSDERPFHERDLYRRYVDRGIAIDAALAWLKANDCTAMHEGNCALSDRRQAMQQANENGMRTRKRARWRRRCGSWKV